MLFRPLPVLTVFTVVSLAILILLGNWQWGRYAAKTGARDAPPPATIVLEGRAEPAKALRLYTVIDARSGWRIAVPVQVGTRTVLLADTFVDGVQPPALDMQAPAREVAVEGRLILPQPNAFAARNQADENRWYEMDAEAMQAALAVRQLEPALFEPVELTYVSPSGARRQIANPFAAAVPGDSLPPERHVGYALTWWGLGLALLGVYVAFHMRAGRLRFG
jgi:surfeit locus 1 family protein